MFSDNNAIDSIFWEKLDLVFSGQVMTLEPSYGIHRYKNVFNIFVFHEDFLSQRQTQIPIHIHIQA